MFIKMNLIITTLNKNRHHFLGVDIIISAWSKRGFNEAETYLY